MLPKATHKNLPRDYDQAKALRRRSSLAEQKMWFELRKLEKFLQLKFRRQQPIHPYIVDFICFPLKLVIELDGQSHDNTQVKDQKRTDYLNKRGYSVLRYTNDDILKNVEGVIETLCLEIQGLASPTPPLTPPARGGEH